MKKVKKRALIIIAILLVCWGITTTIDFLRCKQVQRPLFSIPLQVTDCDVYVGLGYTIIISYKGIIGQEGEQLQGHFYWGWVF